MRQIHSFPSKHLLQFLPNLLRLYRKSPRFLHIAMFCAMPMTIVTLPQASFAEMVFPTEEVLEQLQDRTSVPILLPSQLPFDREEPLQFGVETNQDGYRIDIDGTTQCHITSCDIGSISAERNGVATTPWLDHPRNEFKEIQLANETEGIFINVCGISDCTALVEWQKGDVLYRVTLRYGTEVQLKQMANWAIENGEK